MVQLKHMRQEQQRPEHKHRRRHVHKPLTRRIVGWSMVGLALLGFVLPILPGVVFLGVGIVLLGPHDPTLRRVAIAARVVLRRLSQAKQRHLRYVGCVARSRYRDARLALRMYLHQHECGNSSWREHIALLTATLIGMAAAASAMLVLWHTVL